MFNSVIAYSGLVWIVLWLSACTMQQSRSEFGLIDVERAQAQLELGLAYLEQERLTLAQQHLLKVLDYVDFRTAEGSQAHYGLALLHLRSGNERESEDHFLQALNSETPYPDAENGLGVLRCRQGRVDEAALLFKKAIDNPLYSTPEVAEKNSRACANQ